MRSLVVCLALAACHSLHVAPPANAREGLAIALYLPPAGQGGYAVVDDRRWVQVAGGEIVLDHIDPGAALPSLVIEPLGGNALAIGACTRERIAPPPLPGQKSIVRGTETFAPMIACAASGKPGRYLVRILYVSNKLGYRAEHEVVVREPGETARASVSSHFALQTPPWGARADVTLFDGMPGADQPPREVARGSVMLDGSIAVLGGPAHDTPAHLRWIYDGAVHVETDVPAQDQMWGRDSHAFVWVWLELESTKLAPGPLHAHVELGGDAAPRDIEVPAAGWRQTGGALHLPLWVDDQLRGKRDRWIESAYNAALTDRFVISVTNLGATPRDVWIQERLRPARRHVLGHAWPTKPLTGRDSVRTRVSVPAGKIERVGFSIDYEF